MTIDEAIEHAEHVAANCDGECSENHRQLADWLRELRRARIEIDLLKTLRDGFKADAQRHKAENARLRHALKNSVNCRKFGGCFVCPQFHEHAQYDAMCDNDMLMHELGIEA